MTHRPDEAAGWLGRTRADRDVLDATKARLLAATLDVPAPHAGDPLPPLWHWAWFNDAVPPGRLGRDGHPAPGVVLPPTGLPRRLWAGGRVSFERPLRVGAEVTRSTTITGIRPTRGRSGPLVFVTQRSLFSDVDGTCLTDEIDLVYRTDGRSASAPERPTEAPDVTRGVQPDAVQLFRYSALTFNGHRIHYDADYAREVEGYPGVVIHGPLIATWLAALAADRWGPLRTFTYRGVRPSILGMALGLHAGPDAGGALSLWATQPDGAVTMRAEATARAGD